MATAARVARASTTPVVCSIKPDQDEIRQGRLSERNLELAVRHVLRDGVVVVENAIDHSLLDDLNKKMAEDAIRLRSRDKNVPFNYNQGNLQQDAPPVKRYFDRSVFMSKRCLPILHSTQYVCVLTT